MIVTVSVGPNDDTLPAVEASIEDEGQFSGEAIADYLKRAGDEALRIWQKMNKTAERA